MKRSYISADLAEREFFRNPVHFAAIVNATLFDGKQVIQPENVYELDSVESMVVNHVGDEKIRDLIKRVIIDDYSILIAIECQNHSKRNMVMRTCHYDSLRYLKELKSSQKANAILTITLYFNEHR